MTTNEFFELVASGELSDLDIHNHIQKLTDNFDEDKLNLLCSDFDAFINMKFENWIASFSEDDIDKRIVEWQNKGRALPIIHDEKYKFQWLYVRNFFWRTRWGKPISDEEFEKGISELFGNDYKPKPYIIDDNVLLGGFYFRHENILLSKLRDMLVDLKRKYTSAVYRFDDNLQPQVANNQSIIWLKSDKSLSRFIDALKDQNLIENRETAEIIEQHFKPQTKPQKEPEPIKWLETASLLAYMIKELDDRYIQTKNIWQNTAHHFSVDGETPDNLRQIFSRSKQNKTGKPKNYGIIDLIIKSLSDSH